MNSNLESGLFLPIRFYNSLWEQNRYKRLSVGVGLLDSVYIHVDCTHLAPFQVVLNNYCEEGVSSVTFNLICIDGTETISLPFNANYWELYSNYDTQTTTFSYLGEDDFSASTTNGKWYIELIVNDMCENTSTFYSDLFVIASCGVSETIFATENYRVTSNNPNDKRLIDTTNLRITKI